MKVNINHHIKVRLTPVGREILFDHNNEVNRFLGRPDKPIREPDAEGFHQFQIWDCMAIFGPHMQLGMDVPFEPTVFIDEEYGIKVVRELDPEDLSYGAP